MPRICVVFFQLLTGSILWTEIVYAQIHPPTNKEVLHQVLEDMFQAWSPDSTCDFATAKLPLPDGEKQGILVQVLSERLGTRIANASKEITVEDRSLFELRWTGEGGRWQRRVDIQIRVGVREGDEIHCSTMLFGAHMDTLSRNDLSVVGIGEDFAFTNDAHSERNKSPRRRIIEPLFVLFALTATTYLLFSVRS